MSSRLQQNSRKQSQAQLKGGQGDNFHFPTAKTLSGPAAHGWMRVTGGSGNNSGDTCIGIGGTAAAAAAAATVAVCNQPTSVTDFENRFTDKTWVVAS